MKISLLLIGITILFIFVSLSPLSQGLVNKEFNLILSNGDTLYVGGSGPGNYTNIQDAIDNSNNGDRIFVYSGTYIENLKVNKEITLIGENKNTTIIEGNLQKSIVLVKSENVKIMDFTITEGYWRETGIDIQADNCKVENTLILDCYIGFKLENVRDITIKNSIINRKSKTTKFGFDILNSDFNHIINNTISYTSFSLMLDESDGNYILNNQFRYNEYGIWLDESNDNTVSSNKISQCDFFSFKVQQSNNNRIENNYIHNNEGVGMDLFFSKRNTLKKNLLVNNLFGIGLEYSFLTLIKNNEISSNEYGIYLQTSYGNLILKNNIINNSKNAYFKNAWINRWLGNYWEPHLFGPKIIFGTIFKMVPHGWTYEEVDIMILVKIDWNPAILPYDIGA